MMLQSADSFAWNSSDTARSVGTGTQIFLDNLQDSIDKSEEESERLHEETEQYSREADAKVEEWKQHQQQKELKQLAVSNNADRLLKSRLAEVNAAIRVLLAGKNMENCLTDYRKTGVVKDGYGSWHMPSLVQILPANFTGCSSVWKNEAIDNSISFQVYKMKILPHLFYCPLGQ